MALPKSWSAQTVEKLFSVIGGGTPSTKNDNFWCDSGIPWFSSADIDDDGHIFPRRCVTEIGVANSATNIVPKDSIIVVTRVGLGKVAFLKEPMCFSQDNQALLPLFPEMLDYKYIFYCLHNSMQTLKYTGRGTTISGITKKQLTDCAFPLPPLAEQHRIVAKIDALFSELDKGVEMLQTARAQLRTYRQAVLKMAFSGQLIRKKWNMSSIGAIAEEIKIGPFGTLLHKADYVSGGFPIVNPKHMSNYRIRSEASKTISVEKAEELSSYTIYENDVLIARRGEMGRTAYVSQKENGWLCGTGSMIIRFPKTYNGYLYTMLLSAEQPRKYLVDKSNGTTMDNLNEITIKRLPFPEIPVEDQKNVLSEIESRLSVCDKLEQLVDENLAKAQALRQSILKKAFTGELVPQDPHDEPAEKLLERIKAMKAAATKTTTARRAHR